MGNIFDHDKFVVISGRFGLNPAAQFFFLGVQSVKGNFFKFMFNNVKINWTFKIQSWPLKSRLPYNMTTWQHCLHLSVLSYTVGFDHKLGTCFNISVQVNATRAVSSKLSLNWQTSDTQLILFYFEEKNTIEKLLLLNGNEINPRILKW